MKYETAGDPITGLKWTRKTTAKIADQLCSIGIDISPNTVGRLLKQLGFSLRINHKKICHGAPIDRDQQFAYIKKLRERFSSTGMPIVSVDAKKKELVGNFKNSGATWGKEPVPVNDHDFPSLAKGKAIPYGVYDVDANRGVVFVGTSYNTPEFAVECIEKWWCHHGRQCYPNAKHLLILADSGGSNSARSRVWKERLHELLCEQHGISVTVSHYPAGTSKWNPIDHRLFSAISRNWAGRPLDSYETVLNYLRTTTTNTGLKVKAYLVEKKYAKGIKIPDERMEQLCLTRHPTLAKLNYTLTPRDEGVSLPFALAGSEPKEIEQDSAAPPLAARCDKPLTVSISPGRNGRGRVPPLQKTVSAATFILGAALGLGRGLFGFLPLGRNGVQHELSTVPPATEPSTG